MNGRLKSDDGFTITEILIVLAIMGLLAGLAIPIMSGSIEKAREATLRTNLNTLRTVIDEYYADHLSYPPDLNTLVKEDYLRSLPQDTIERSAQDWQLVISEDGTGIMDVKSRSNKEAKNGSIYADW